MSVDAYIYGLDMPARVVVGSIRQTVIKIAPEAVEAIKYNMPVFSIGAAYIFYLGGWKTHAGIYPVARHYDFEAEIAPYRSDKDTVKFPYNRTIPHDLIARIVRARLAEITV